MRSTRKNGPRTRAVKLMHATHPASLESRVKTALAASQVVALVSGSSLGALHRAAAETRPRQDLQGSARMPCPPRSKSARPQRRLFAALARLLGARR